MIWLATFVFFLVYSLVFLGCMYLYANILFFLSKKKSLAYDILALFLYLLMIIFIGFPFFLSSNIDEFQNKIHENTYFYIFTLLFYIFALLPGLFCFNTFYIKKMKLINRC